MYPMPPVDQYFLTKHRFRTKASKKKRWNYYIHLVGINTSTSWEDKQVAIDFDDDTSAVDNE